MTEPALSEDFEVLSDVTDDLVREAAAFREEPAGPGRAAEPTREAPALPADWRATISPKGYAFIVRWETGGQAYYERVLKGRPEWPGYASGVTIGCGFDLGYHTAAQFLEQWGTRLGKSDFGRLAPLVGFRTTAPHREAKVARAKALVRSLSDIVIPWRTAIEQFDNAKYPDILAQMYHALAHLDRLHPHCRAALLSLTFNRGPAFAAAGDRFREMRAVGEAMRAGEDESFALIPGLIRSMSRIWGKDSGLARRREGEAQLFEEGLEEQSLAAKVVQIQTEDAGARRAPALEGGLDGVREPLVEDHGGVEEAQTDVAAPEEAEEEGEEEAEVRAWEGRAAGASEVSVRWNSRDDEQPDYRHLDTSLSGRTFELVPESLDVLIRANAFAPLPGRMLFALRGASLGAVDKREGVASLAITDQRPDHRDFRCVIGVYDPAEKRLWAYRASTVPNAHYVYRCYALARAQTSMAALMGNILPTGCYTYTVGTHRKGERGEIPTVFRLGTTSSNASRVVVLRSLSDVIYDRFDAFPAATPADNIHPGQKQTGFSSAGCLTLPGFYRNGRHMGLWADFRAAAGVTGGSDGRQFSLLLVTGLDAALAVSVVNGERPADDLRRLRHGSTGDAVAALQAALGLSPDPSRTMGPVTRRALVEKQAAALGWADGVYSPAMDGLLGFKVYG